MQQMWVTAVFPQRQRHFGGLRKGPSFTSVLFYKDSCERTKESNKICFGPITQGASQNKL